MPLIKSGQAPPAVRAFSMADVETAAKNMLIRAQQKAEALLIEAQQQAELLKKEAQAQGFAEGRNLGIEQGRKDGAASGHTAALNENKAQLSSLIQTLTKQTTELDASRLKFESQTSNDVMAFALAIAQRITKRQAEIDPQVLTANLNEALKLVVQASDIRIAIHPQDRKTLEAELPNLKLAWPNLSHIELIDDAKIGKGGCKIFTREGSVDASLETQLDRIVSELMPG